MEEILRKLIAIQSEVAEIKRQLSILDVNTANNFATLNERINSRISQATSDVVSVINSIR